MQHSAGLIDWLEHVLPVLLPVFLSDDDLFQTKNWNIFMDQITSCSDLWKCLWDLYL
jgi:hypothetical protein